MAIHPSHEQLFEKSEADRTTAAAAQWKAEQAGDAYSTNLAEREAQIFNHYLPDPEATAIEGLAIANFAEAAMRLHSISPKKAARRAEILSEIVDPSAPLTPQATFFYPAGSDQGTAIIVRNENSKVTPFSYSLSKDGRNAISKPYRLRIDGGNPNDKFKHGAVHLEPSFSHPVDWAVGGAPITVGIDFTALDLLGKPEDMELSVDAQHIFTTDSMYTTQDAIQAALFRNSKYRLQDDQTVYDAETVALLAAFHHSLGQQPSIPFIDRHHGSELRRSHLEMTHDIAASYVATLLTGAHESDEHAVRRGVPVVLHAAAMQHQGITAAESAAIVDSGIEQSNLNADQATRTELHRKLGITGVRTGLHIPAADILV